MKKRSFAALSSIQNRQQMIILFAKEQDELLQVMKISAAVLLSNSSKMHQVSGTVISLKWYTAI